MTTIISRSSKRAHRESGVSRDLSLTVDPKTVDSAELALGHTWRVRDRAEESTRSRQASLGVKGSGRYSHAGALSSPDWTGRSTALPTVTRTKVTPKPSTTQRLIGSRLGSQQQVSERGRRLSVQKKGEFSKFSFFVISLLSLSVVVAVMLSGMVTQKTFDIKDLAQREATLTNEVETLHRDVQQLQSTADIVERAGDMGLVVPAQPGVLSVSPDGTTQQQLDATAESRPVIDVNALRSGAAVTRNAPEKTQGLKPAAASPSAQSSMDHRDGAEESTEGRSRDSDATAQIRAERDTSRNRMNAVPYQNNN